MASPTDTRTGGSPARRQEDARGADAVVPDDSHRRVVVDILATAVMDLLLAEVEKAARGGSDELSTC